MEDWKPNDSLLESLNQNIYKKISLYLTWLYSIQNPFTIVNIPNYNFIVENLTIECNIEIAKPFCEDLHLMKVIYDNLPIILTNLSEPLYLRRPEVYREFLEVSIKPGYLYKYRYLILRGLDRYNSIRLFPFLFQYKYERNPGSDFCRIIIISLDGLENPENN